MGDDIVLIDSAQQIALKVKSLLADMKIFRSDISKNGSLFYLTDIPHSFKETGKRFLGEPLEDVTVIDI